VKPLDETMLANWRKYLDMEEKESSTTAPDRVVKLYERCLVAACYYSEFWLRYARWLESNRGVEEARAVFVRATTIFLPRRPDVHLEYAIFEEIHGDIPKARQIYENLASTLPGHVESTLRFASFERRHKQLDSASAIFETALSISSLDGKSGPFLSMHYARFLHRVLGASARAREVYDKALQKFPEHKGLWMAYIQFEIAQQEEDMEARVLALYARAVAEDSRLTADEKHDMWQNYVEFAADWTNGVATLRRLQDTFRTLYPASSFKSETARKRPLEATASAASADHAHHANNQPNKIPRTTPVAAAATTPVAAAAVTAAAYTQAAAQYPYAQYAQYQGYTGYPAAGYTYPYTNTAQAQYGYGYTYPYTAYTQPTS